MNKVKDWFSQVSNGTLIVFGLIIVTYVILGIAIINGMESFGKEELETILMYFAAMVTTIVGAIRHNPVTQAGFAGADATKAYRAGIYPDDEGQGIYADIDPDTTDEYELNTYKGDE